MDLLSGRPQLIGAFDYEAHKADVASAGILTAALVAQNYEGLADTRRRIFGQVIERGGLADRIADAAASVQRAAAVADLWWHLADWELEQGL